MWVSEIFFINFYRFQLSYRETAATTPDALKGINYNFSHNSSNLTLHTHLDRIHKKEYLNLCKANGWEMQLLRMKAVQVIQASKGDSVPYLQFLHSTFVQSFVRSIVADDQVSNTPQESPKLTVFNSLSMSWSVVSFTIPSSCCMKTWRRKTLLTVQHFVKLQSPPGDHGSTH